MTEKPKIVRSDGRGILAGDYLNLNRDITRSNGWRIVSLNGVLFKSTN